MSIQLNRLTASFHNAMSMALASENKNDVITHLRTMTNVFTQVCTTLQAAELEKERAVEDRNWLMDHYVDMDSKVAATDDIIQQVHLLAAAKNRNSTDLASQMIFDNIANEVRENMGKIGEIRSLETSLEMEKGRNRRLMKHVNELSKRNIMHLMATRFYARELAAMRQMMDLVQNASSIDSAVKSKVWDDIEAENRLLRLNTLWLINRINSPDRRGAVFEAEDDWHSEPRVVILIRENINQGLGLEITGGSDKWRPIIVSAKLKGSMADDDELKVNDRILAIDGTFVTNHTTHSEAMEMLEKESAKDFMALIVSQFDATKFPSKHDANVSISSSSTQLAHSPRRSA